MTDLENLLKLLQAWLDQHRQSILDGTVSCKKCGALLLQQNEGRHNMWHRERRHIDV